MFDSLAPCHPQATEQFGSVGCQSQRNLSSCKYKSDAMHIHHTVRGQDVGCTSLLPTNNKQKGVQDWVLLGVLRRLGGGCGRGPAYGPHAKRSRPVLTLYPRASPRRNPGENSDPATFRPFHPPGTPRPPGPSPTGQGPSLWPKEGISRPPFGRGMPRATPSRA